MSAGGCQADDSEHCPAGRKKKERLTRTESPAMIRQSLGKSGRDPELQLPATYESADMFIVPKPPLRCKGAGGASRDEGCGGRLRRLRRSGAAPECYAASGAGCGVALPPAPGGRPERFDCCITLRGRTR